MNMKKMLAVVAAATLVAAAAPAFANPFSDVPLNHWAYDAVEELSSKGILEGYPNGTFRGNRPMTRYEIASMVARMMDAELDGAELDKVKALVVEFQPELEALGVKVDSFDARLSNLEKGFGGMSITGQFRTDTRVFDEPSNDGGADDNGMQISRGRLFIHKELGNGVSVDTRWHSDKLDRYYFTVKDFFGFEGLTVKVGAFAVAWDDSYLDYDMFFTDTTYRGFDVKYTKGGFSIEGLVANNKGAGSSGVYTDNASNEFYGVRLGYEAPKYWINLTGMHTNSGDENYDAYWVNAGLNITNDIKLFGTYFIEDIEDDLVAQGASGDDSPSAFKVALTIDQDLLKFTSLTAEYANIDAGFIMHNAPWGYENDNGWADDYTSYQAATDEDTDVLYINLQQNWTNKFYTQLRYVNYDADDDATEYAVVAHYTYSPNLWFELAYVDYDGRFESGSVDGDYDNSVVRLRTYLTF